METFNQEVRTPFANAVWGIKQNANDVVQFCLQVSKTLMKSSTSAKFINKFKKKAIVMSSILRKRKQHVKDVETEPTRKVKKTTVASCIFV